MRLLPATEIVGVLVLFLEIDLAEEVLDQDVLGRDRGVGFELEEIMSVWTLPAQQGGRRPRDRGADPFG